MPDQTPVLQFVLRTLAEVRAAAREAAAPCADPPRVEAGLRELLVNAIEHGNLGIDHVLKTELLADGRWEAEIERRLSLPPACGRSVALRAWRTATGWCFEIADDGAGFDWRPWLAADPRRAAAAHGRGIALARGLYFDELYFLPPGNRVRALIFESPAGDG